MNKLIGWGIAGLAAVVAVVLAVRSAGAAESGDLCLATLPEPFKQQAKDIIKEGDVAHMESFAAQCDAKGWHCAAKELRLEAKKTVPEPYRSDWKRLISRAQTESSGQLVVDLQSAMLEARKRGFSIEGELKAAIGLVTPRVLLADVKEEPMAGAVAASYGLGGDPSAFVDHMRRLSTDLTRGGYVKAAKEATAAADGVQKEIDAAAAAKAKYEASCAYVFDQLPIIGFSFTSATIKDSVKNVREWAKRLYATGPTAAKNFAASVLDDEAASMMGAPSAEVGPGVYWEAAKCLRGDRT